MVVVNSVPLNLITTTVYVQIFEACNFRGLLFLNISRKQFSRIKSFEYTVFQNFVSLIFANFRNPRKLRKFGCIRYVVSLAFCLHIHCVHNGVQLKSLSLKVFIISLQGWMHLAKQTPVLLGFTILFGFTLVYTVPLAFCLHIHCV